MTYTPQNWHPGSQTNLAIADLLSLRAMDEALLSVGATAFVSADGHGAVGDAETDDTAAIQSAIDACSAGGAVIFAPKTYNITSTLNVNTDGVYLIGTSYQPLIFGGGAQVGTRINWAGSVGSGPMIDFCPPSNSGVALMGGGAERMQLYGNGASIGIRQRSIWRPRFSEVHIHECGTACWDFSSFASGFSGGHDNVYRSMMHDCSAFTFTYSGNGIRMFSTHSSGGATLCTFKGFMGDTKDAVTIDLSSCDDIFFYDTNIGNSGTGHSIELRGKDVGSGYQDAARNIHFWGLHAKNGIYVRAGDGTRKSTDNSVWGLSFEDGIEAEPTVESGCELFVYDTRGSHRFLGNHGKHAIDFYQGTYDSGFGPIRYPNNISVYGRNAADDADVAMFKFNTLNEMEFAANARFSGLLNVSAAGGQWMAEGANVNLGTSTGTKIGTATGQKLGFWNTAPAAQQVLATGTGKTVDNVITFLQSLGLCRQS